MKSDQRGMADVWFLAFSVVLVLFLAAASFGIWAFGGMQDYKNNAQSKIDAAASAATESANAKKDADFAEKEKSPLRIYTGPEAYGSVTISYPKTWSVYMDESGHGNAPLDGSFNPQFVPGLQSGNNVALRVQVIDDAYTDVARSMESQVKNGTVTAQPYESSKVKKAVGLRLDGEIVNNKDGAMIIVPIRDKTLKVWTEASQYVKDFDKIILPNLTFSP